MIFTVQQNQTDSEMIEFYRNVGTCTYLVCVVHEGCFSGSNIVDMLNKKGSIKVKLEVIDELP